MIKAATSDRLLMNKNHSLLEVTPHLYPDVVGGIGLNVDSLATALVGDFDTTVAANWMGPTSAPTDREYDLKAFPTRLVVFGNPISIRMVAWLMKNIQRFDLVHSHSHLFLTSTIAVFLAKLKQTPVVLTSHGLISFSQPVLLQRLWIRFVSSIILPMCDQVLCFSDADANQLVTAGVDRARVVVAPNGIDLALFGPTSRNFSGRLKIVWLGRIVKDKGLQHLLQGLAQATDIEGRIDVTIFGEGPLETQLREFVERKQLGDIVTFQRPVSYRDVPNVLASHDVLILPSLTEGLPRVAIEALATEMPLLSSALPQLTTSFEDCAVYFPPGDADGIAGAIRWAEANRAKLKELGARGRRLVERKFAWDNMVQNRKQLFLNLLERKGTRNRDAKFGTQ